MARSHSHTTGAGSRTPPPPGAGVGRGALSILGASTLLAAPIVLWTRFGDGNATRTGLVAAATALGFWALARHVAGPRDALEVPEPPAAPPACRSDVRRSTPLPRAAPRMRAGSPASTWRQPARPPARSRPKRDVRCVAGVPSTRRKARRRTRP